MINSYTVKALIDWLEEDWECFVGPYKAFFELPTLNGEVYHCVYKTYALGALEPNAEAKIVLEFEDTFNYIKRIVNSRMLVWRYPDKIQLDVKIVPTREQFQDGLLLPEPNALHDFDTSTWYEKVGETTQTIVYTRLCIPALVWTPHDPIYLEKPEGAAMRFI